MPFEQKHERAGDGPQDDRRDDDDAEPRPQMVVRRRGSPRKPQDLAASRSKRSHQSPGASRVSINARGAGGGSEGVVIDATGDALEAIGVDRGRLLRPIERGSVGRENRLLFCDRRA
jgi:hypothetical protein